MAKLKRGDRITLPTIRPSHWNKKGEMDKFLGKSATIQSVYDKTDTLQQISFVTDDNLSSGFWQFLSTDLESAFQIGDLVSLKREFKIFRDFGERCDICDDDGNCLTVYKTEIFKTQLNSNTMKAMKDAVLTVAKQLAKANNTVTTLEIKTELRRDYPYYYWSQASVSDYMSQLAGDGVFTYTDNGTFRTYSLTRTKISPIVAPKASPIVATKTIAKAPVVRNKNLTVLQALDILQIESKNFVSAEFKDGKIVDAITIRGQKKSPSGYLGPKIGKVATIKVGKKVYKVI